MSDSELRRTAMKVGSGLVVAALATLVIVLAFQNRDLRKQVGELRRLELGLPDPGQPVPAFATETVASGTLDSAVVGATGDGRAQLLFFFRSTCPH